MDSDPWNQISVCSYRNQTRANKSSVSDPDPACVHITCIASIQSLSSIPETCSVQRAASIKISQSSPLQRPPSKTSGLPEPHVACGLVSLPAMLVSRNIPETSSHALNKTAVLTTYKEAGNPATLFQPWKPQEKLYKLLSAAF